MRYSMSNSETDDFFRLKSMPYRDVDVYQMLPLLSQLHATNSTSAIPACRQLDGSISRIVTRDAIFFRSLSIWLGF